MKINEKDAQILQNIGKHCEAILDTAAHAGGFFVVHMRLTDMRFENQPPCAIMAEIMKEEHT